MDQNCVIEPFYRPRETNKFQIQVNVAAQEKVTFVLTYRELLKRTNGLYNHVIYINPGQVVDDLKINVLIKEYSNVTTIKTPPLRNELLQEGPEGMVITFKTLLNIRFNVHCLLLSNKLKIEIYSHILIPDVACTNSNLKIYLRLVISFLQS